MPDRYVGELRVLEQINTYEFAFEADILRTGPVQGGRWEFANIENNYKSFSGKPVLIAYVGRRIGDGHNASERIDNTTGERYRSFTDATAERIIGLISENESDLTLYESDGYTWLRVKGRIWTYYAKEAVAEIVRTGRMDVSIEAEVYDVREEDGREVYETWQGIGLTVLGAGVDPAVPGANIRALADMQEEFESMKLRVASLVKEEQNKPQNNSKKKGMTKSMRLSKQQLRELQAKFADHSVLAADQQESGKIAVCLMSKTGSTAVYVMESIDDPVYAEKIQTVNAQTHFCAEGCDDVVVDAGDLTELASENAKECLDRAECAEKELKECKSEMERMVNAENARRLKAAQKAAEDALADFNKDREDKVSADALKSLSADIEAGKFTALCNADGIWNGDEAVTEKVLAICAKADMEYQKRMAEKRNTEHPMTWGNTRTMSAAPGTVGELFASKQN